MRVRISHYGWLSLAITTSTSRAQEQPIGQIRAMVNEQE